MKKNILIGTILFIMLLCVPLISAEDFATVNKTYTLDVGIISNGGWFSVAGINISIFEPLTRNLVVSHQPMTSLSTGQYYYNFVPNQTGVYYYVFEMFNGTATVFEGGGTFTSMDDIAQDTVWSLDTMISVFLLFSVGILLVVLGEYIGNFLFTMMGGLWLLGNSVQLVFTGQGFVSPLFFGLAGVALIYHGVIRLTEERERQEKKKLMNITGDKDDN
jgi:hypothetical protein